MANEQAIADAAYERAAEKCDGLSALYRAYAENPRHDTSVPAMWRSSEDYAEAARKIRALKSTPAPPAPEADASECPHCRALTGEHSEWQAGYCQGKLAAAPEADALREALGLLSAAEHALTQCEKPFYEVADQVAKQIQDFLAAHPRGEAADAATD